MIVERAFFKVSNEHINVYNQTENPSNTVQISNYLDHVETAAFGGEALINYAAWGDFDAQTPPHWRYKLLTKTPLIARALSDAWSGTLEFINVVASAKSGDIKAENFINVFYKPGNNTTLLNPITLPLFSIVDHNSAHHLPYVLANKGFKSFGREGKRRVVINFDTHIDHSAFSATDPDRKINCHSWGSALHTKLTLQDESVVQPADAYIVIGATKGTNTTKGWYISNYETYAVNDFTATTLSTASPCNINDVMDSIVGDGKLPYRWDACDVYITVDRDFMQMSNTPYGDGVYNQVLGRAAVKGCLSYLSTRTVKLVGFDVTGLPCERGQSRNFFELLIKLLFYNTLPEDQKPAKRQAIIDFIGGDVNTADKYIEFTNSVKQYLVSYIRDQDVASSAWLQNNDIQIIFVNILRVYAVENQIQPSDIISRYRRDDSITTYLNEIFSPSLTLFMAWMDIKDFYEAVCQYGAQPVAQVVV